MNETLELLRDEYLGDGYRAFETNLQAQGRLDELEQAGILPIGADPARREEALKYLYLGAILEHLFSDLLIVPILIFSGQKEDLVSTRQRKEKQ